MIKYALLLVVVLAGCGGGNSGGSGGKPPAPVPPPPPPPPPPVMCEWDDTIPADDPLCVEPPPPPPPPCQLSVSWVNPTQDMNDNDLDVDALTGATVYFFRIPEVPRDIDMVHAAEAYTLVFTYVGPPEDTGVPFYVYMTVTSEHGESDASNEVTKDCQ